MTVLRITPVSMTAIGCVNSQNKSVLGLVDMVLDRGCVVEH